MKFLATNAVKGLLLSLGAVAVVTTGVIAFNNNNSLKDDTKQVSVVEKGLTDTKNPKLVEAENEVNASKENLEAANKEVEQAESEHENAKQAVIDAENAITEAEEAKKKAEAEVQSAQTVEEKNAALEKVKAAEKAIDTAKETKKAADETVQKTEKAVNEAKETKKAAEDRVQKAEDNKEAVEKEINKTPTSEEQTPKAEEPKQETKKEEKQETKPQTENKTTTSTKTTTKESNTTTNKSKTESQNNNKTTNSNTTKNNEAGGAANQRDLTAADWEKINEALKKEQDRLAKEGKLEEPEEHTVEFHFYSTLNPLPVRLYDHQNYYTTQRCGEDKSGCIWFVEFACDLNECVGFPDSQTGKLSGDVVYSRRADISEFTMKAPEARYGYKFKQWELISERKNTLYGKEGIAYKYIAIYEKI